MKALKIVATVILGIILFLSLFVFGIAFNVKQTVLNPKFIAAEINKIPITSIFQNTTAYEMDIPNEIKDSLEITIAAMEPQIKQQTGDALKSVYDYLLGKKASPELATTLRDTILSNTFVNSLIDNLDLATLLTDSIHDQLNTQGIPRELLPLLDQIKPILTKNEPQLKTQLKAAMPPVLDYITGKTNSFKVTFTLDAVVNDLETAAKTILKNNPVFAGATDAQINSYITQNLDPQLKDIASGLTLDQTTLGQDAQLTQSLNEAENSLAEVRPYILQFQTYYIWLIIFMIVVAGGIVALNLSVRKATCAIGSVLLAYGIIEFVPLMVFQFLAPRYFYNDMLADVPAYLNTYARQAIFDSISPLWWFSLGTLIAGIALLVVSFVYRPAQPTITAPATTNEQIQS